MRQIIGIVVFVPLAIVVGIFAVENRAQLALEIWPLPGVHQMWASVWILGLLAIGTVVGMAIGWLAGTGARRRARRAERLNRTLEKQLAEREADLPPVPAPSAAGALPAPDGRASRITRLDD
jgi:hypothetical protein